MVDDATGKRLPVKIGDAIPAGTNNIGDVDVLSIAAGDNNIGNVDIVTVPAPLSTTGGGTEATALRVTLANDSTGVVSVDDNGGSLTVDGTVTANAGTGPWPVTDNGGSLTVDGTVAISGTVTVGSHAVTNAGTFAVQDSEKVTDNAAFTDGTTKVDPAGFVFDEVAGTALTENDAVAARVDSKRAQVLVIEDETTRGRRVTVTASNALKVDGSAVTQPVSGTVTANLAAGTNNIGDVDVLSVPAPLSTTGGGTEATALRVTVATDSTGVLSVDDNGGTLTVDAPVGTPVNVQIGDGTRTATVRDTGTSDSLNVAIVDGSGNQITTFGGGTQYTEDVAAATDPVGTVPILVRQDTPATVTNANGDNVAQRGTNYGAAYVQVLNSTGSFVDSFGGGTQYTEDAAAAANPTGTAPILVRADTPATVADANGDNVAQRGTNYGAAFVQVVSSSGGFIDTFGGSGGTAQADRSAFTDGTTTATPIAGVLNDTPTDPTEDQAAAVRITSKRALHVNLRDDAGDSCMDGANNALRVNIVAGAGSGGTAQADESAFTEGTTSMTPIGGVLNDTITSDPTEDQAAAVRITAKRAFHTNLRKNDGTEIASGGGTEANALRVTVASDSTGNLAVNTELPTAAALADGASATPTTPTVGAVPLLMNATTLDRARSVVNGMDSTGTGIQAVGVVGQFDNSGTSAVTENQFAVARISASRALLIEGSLNHDAAGSAAMPLAAGGFASAAAPADVSADGDVVKSWHLRNGSQVTTLSAAGALIGGDATNGLDTDVTRSVTPLDRTASGSLTAAATSVTLNPAQGTGSATIQITGTWVATVQFEGSTDGTNFYALNALPVAGGAFASSATANGQWLIGTAGLAQARVRCSAYTSGTIVITIVASIGSQVVSLANSIPSGINNIGDVDVLTVPAPLSTTGGGTEATALRVTLANDSTGVINVAELPAAASLADATANPSTTSVGVHNLVFNGTTWDRARSAIGDAAGTTGMQNILFMMYNGSTHDRARGDTTNGLDVDVTRVIPGTSATHLGKAIDSAAGATDTGVASLAIRDDTLTTLTPVDGDYVPLRVNSQGALHVTGGGGGTQYAVDDAAGATPTGTVALVVRKDSAASLAGTDGDVTALQVDANGALRVTGGGGGGTEYTVDAVAPAAPTGATFVMERDDVLSTLTEVEGDWTNPRAAETGALWVKTDPGSSLTATCGGFTAPDSPIAANPVTTGGRASDAVPTAMSADGDVVHRWLDRRGAAKSVMVDDAGDSCMDGTNNALRVNIVAGAGSGGTAQADESAFTEGTTSMTPIGGVLNDTITSDPSEDQAAAVRITAKRAFHVNLRDVAGVESVVPGTSATHLGKAVDAVAGATDTGVAVLAVRDDSLAALTPADGDYTHLRVNSQGALHVTGGGGGTEYTVNAVVPADPTGATFVMERDDALSALTEVEGDWTNPRSNANGALWVTVDGTVTVGSHAVTNAGTFAVQESGAALTALQLIDDTVATTAAAITGKGIAAAGTDGTNARILKTDTNGELQVDVLTLPAIPAGTNNIGDVDVLSIAAGDNNIGNVDIVTMPNVTLAAGTNTNEVVGDAAHDAAVAGNPLLIGFEARTTDGTAVNAAGDAVRGIADTLGKQVVLLGAVHDRIVSGRANFTTTTAADIIAAQGAGVRIVVTSYSISNSHATVGTKVELRDGTTVKIIDHAAAVGGGCARAGGYPIFISTANTAVTARCVTTGADVEVNVSGYTIAN